MRAFVLAIVLAVTTLAHAADPVKLLSSDIATQDSFGYSVAISGDTAVVGAYRKNGFTGAAYVFRWDGAGWSEEQALLPSDLAPLDRFGSAVAIHRDTIVVSSPSKVDASGDDTGAAYVFTRSGSAWTEQTKLLASDRAAGDQFGQNGVAVQDDTVVIGAIRADAPSSDSGAAYVFTRSAGMWTERAKLVASDGASGDQFGRSAGIDGDTIVVSAHRKDSAMGAAYIFTGDGSTWTEEQKLTASDAQSGNQLGWHASIEGDTIALAAPFADDAAGLNQGAVYIYNRTLGAWSEDQKLLAANAVANDRMGQTLAMQGDTLVTTANFADTAAGVDSGEISVFTRSAGVWQPQAAFPRPEAGPGSFSSPTVAIWNDWLVAGDIFDDEAATDAGAVWIIERVNDVWRTSPAQTVASITPASSGAFGRAVAIDGDTAVVTASGEAGFVGRATVFTREDTNTWRFQQQLAPSDGSVSQFGWSAAIDGDTIVIGATSGAAFVFTRTGSTWTEQQKLTASDGASGDLFGWSVAIQGDTVAVGAQRDDNSQGLRAGSVYIYTRTGSTWTEQTRLQSPFTIAFGGFGAAVDLDGDTLAIGADGSGIEFGYAYLFTGAGAAWAFEDFVAQPNPSDFARFGRAVTLEGDMLVVGSSVGEAYVCERAGAAWTLSETIPPPPGASSFGVSLDLDGDNLLIGAPSTDSGNGAAFLYQRAGNWRVVDHLESPEPTPDERFGSSVALSGEGAVIGSPQDDQTLEDAGTASFLALTPEDHTPRVENLRSSIVTASLSSAVADALTNDVLLATPQAIGDDPTLDPGSMPVFIDSTGSMRVPHTGTVQVSTGSIFRSGNGGDTLLFAPATVRSGAALASSGALLEWRSLLLQGGDIIAESLMINDSLTGAGAITSTTTTNNGAVTIQADTNHYGDYTNNGTTTIQSGTLTILGALTDNGVMIGDFTGAARSAPGEVFIDGPYAAAPIASLTLRNATMKLGADADFAIDDHSAFDLASSELRMVGVTSQSLEAMSTDIGASADGLDRALAGHFPLGALRIGPTPTTVEIVDTRDNDQSGQSIPEAIYADTLIVEAGATLNTNGHTVYYSTLILDGEVDDLANLIQIAPCTSDLTGDGQTNGADLGLLLGSWGTPQGDVNGDGVTDGADLGLLLGSWGGCE